MQYNKILNESLKQGNKAMTTKQQKLNIHNARVERFAVALESTLNIIENDTITIDRKLIISIAHNIGKLNPDLTFGVVSESVNRVCKEFNCQW